MPTTPDINNSPARMDRRLWAAYSEEDGYDVPRRQSLQRRTLTARAFGLKISKQLQYVVLGPTPGISISKLIQYVVLETIASPPALSPNLRAMLTSMERIDDDEAALAPNLNLRRRVQTPFPAYVPTPLPIAVMPPSIRQSVIEPTDEYPINLVAAMRRFVIAPPPPPAPPVPWSGDLRRRNVVDTGPDDEAQPNLNLRMRGYTSPEAYRVLQQPVSDIGLATRRKLSLYAEDEETTTFGTLLARRAMQSGASSLVTTGTNFAPVIIMA